MNELKSFLKPSLSKAVMVLCIYGVLLFLSLQCGSYETHGGVGSSIGMQYPCGEFSKILLSVKTPWEWILNILIVYLLFNFFYFIAGTIRKNVK